MSARRVVIASLLIAAVAAIALSAPLGADYPGPTCPTCDYAGPPIESLIHGQLQTFFHQQPVMGSFSLLLRAPFAAVSYLGHHTTRSEYRLGALGCLMALGVLVWALLGMMERRHKSWFAQLLVGGLIVASPLTFKALSWGHPEELLGGALCVGAILLAYYGKPKAAGIILGLAVATKPWALLAVLPTIAVARQRRLALVVFAAAAAAALTLPMMLGDPGRFWRMYHVYGVAGPGVTPPDIWWSYGHQAGMLLTPHGAVPAYVVPSWVWTVAHPLVMVLGVVIAALYWRQSTGARAARQADGIDLSGALHLLALVLLVRCVLDPTDYSYYHAPFLLALVAGEAVGPRRFPYVAIIATAFLWILNEVVAPHHGPGVLHSAYLIWALAMAAYLALEAFAPQSIRQALRGFAARAARPATSS